MAARNGSRSQPTTALQFTKPLQDQTCKQGEGVVLEGCVQGIPAPEIRWDKSNVPVLTSRNLYTERKGSRCRLVIRSCSKKEAGKYTCVATNRSGSVKSCATVFIEGSSPKSQKTSPPPVIKSTTKQPKIEAPLVVPNTEAIKEVLVPEKEGSPPKIVQPLEDGTAVDGKPFLLSCEVNGDPEPTIKWQKDSHPVFHGEDFKLQVDGSRANLSIEEVFPEDEGRYVCVAKNRWGESDTSCWIKVRETQESAELYGEPPIFTQKLCSMEIYEGDSVTFTVKVEGTRPLEIVWVHNDQEIKDCNDFRYCSSPDGVTHSLVISDVFHEDSGLYVCEVYNKHGHADSVCKLTVKDRFPLVDCVPASDADGPDMITKVNGHVDACSEESEDIEINEIQDEVMLIKDGRSRQSPLNFIDSFEVSEDRFSPELYSSTRDIPAEEIEDDELCISSDEKQSSENEISSPLPNLVNGVTEDIDQKSPTLTSPSSSVTLPRPSSAQIVRGPQSISVLRGDTVTLRTHFIGHPPPTVQWIKKGKVLTNDSRITISIEECMSVLILHDAIADDSGKYVVTVANPGGSDCHFASVAVEGPPDPPAGRPNICNVTNHSLVVSWYGSAYDGGSVITGYVVEMCTIPEDKWTRVSAACHSTSYVVRDLLPERHYAFRVRAVNVHGMSPPGKESDSVHLTERRPSSKWEEDEGFASFEHKVIEIEDGSNFLDMYDLKEEVGKGRFGVVYKCQEKSTEELRAAKIVRCVKARDKAKVREEVNIMNKLHHPKLLHLAAAFENPREMILVTEYISGGELFERITADDFVLTEDECVVFMRQICEGVSYMHENSIIHLDLKPENILCKSKTSHQIKIIDFGLAKQHNPNEVLRVLFGTPEFVAPEVISYEPISPACDMWSVGVICYVLLSGLSPFMGENDAETFTNITRAEFDFEDEAFDAISDEAKSFINKLLLKRPEKRLSAADCLQHVWLVKRYRSRKSIQLCTDKLKRFCVRRKWQKTGTAIRALGRMVSLSGVGTSWSSLGNTSTSESDSSSTAPSLRKGINGHETFDENDEEVTEKDLCVNGDSSGDQLYFCFGKKKLLLP